MDEVEQENAAKPKRKRATKRETAMRDARMVRALARGETIDEVAINEGLTLMRARERVAAAVAKRSLDPTEDFVAIQVTRLDEAMLVAYGAMKDGNLAAVDRVLKITREYDRYHGLALTLAKPAGAPADLELLPAPAAPALPAPSAPALSAPQGEEVGAPVASGDGRTD